MARPRSAAKLAEPARHAHAGVMADDEPILHIDPPRYAGDAQGEDWPDKSTVAVIEAARQSARECTETYERIMVLLAEGERLTGRAPGPRKHPKRGR